MGGSIRAIIDTLWSCSFFRSPRYPAVRTGHGTDNIHDPTRVDQKYWLETKDAGYILGQCEATQGRILVFHILAFVFLMFKNSLVSVTPWIKRRKCRKNNVNYFPNVPDTPKNRS